MQLDDSLVKRLLKVAIREESPLNDEALECMSLVYNAASDDLQLGLSRDSKIEGYFLTQIF